MDGEYMKGVICLKITNPLQSNVTIFMRNMFSKKNVEWYYVQCMESMLASGRISSVSVQHVASAASKPAEVLRTNGVNL